MIPGPATSRKESPRAARCMLTVYPPAELERGSNAETTIKGALSVSPTLCQPPVPGPLCAACESIKIKIKIKIKI